MDEQLALELVKAGKNVLVCGKAGSGKSHFIGALLDHTKLKRDEIALTALTGRATVSLSHPRFTAQTVMKWAGLTPKNAASEKTALAMFIGHRRARVALTKLLIVDEVSMMSALLFGILDRLCRVARDSPDKPFGGMQLVFVGDMLQLPPVGDVDTASMDRFYETKLFDSCFQAVEFTSSYRHDPVYDVIMTNISRGKCTSADLAMLNTRVSSNPSTDALWLYSRNVDVDDYNAEMFRSLPGKVYTYAIEWGDASPLTKTQELRAGLLESTRAVETLQIKIKSRVMITANIHVESGLANGQMCTVVDARDTEVCVELDSGLTVWIGPWEWKYEPAVRESITAHCIPLVLGYAMTIHKSQGLTLDSVCVGPTSSMGQTHALLYVALSRARRLSGIQLRAPVNMCHISVDPAAIRFYDQLRHASAKRKGPSHLAEESDPSPPTKRPDGACA
jgi:ATP-dependent exoDNAse (exonuclease V) alpha subunit